ncbi:MAG: hydroxymethylbilane synthase [Polaribacter sp.]|uniref:hydroxymethylbilane synthase n=1 Tax=Polaribacter sp. TaxID=1920175 RepID=UPI002622AA70|nr:hydroxymethylbilane synthase [Polaribacter sp.]MBT3742670.1 hydroxymethylbilane synthase [Polaribacter sp.]MDG1195244.1 hydroxymethylbilane synthase [Polaribacter sp.]MDG1402922.1 hydroxymethylbilane synthase [Polaribacter sp.]
MQKIIRIGTRDSELALWQANKVRVELKELGYESVLVPIKSLGDIVLDKPLYELGVTGVFTKSLDIAMLNKEIDIAVHSLKDVPTVLPEGITQAAVLRRDDYSDVLVFKGTEEFFGQPNAIIATGSLRRKAMWLNRYPTHTVVGLRGNVNTRLEKLEQSETWNGAVFATAGLYRLGKIPSEAIKLSWMIPAPGQGAIMVTCLQEDDYVLDACEQLNHRETEICTTIEREFLHLLEGGCTAPIGALAYIDGKTEEINFKGVLLNKDGSKKITVNKIAKVGSHEYLAKDCADYVINRGGKELMLEDDVADNICNIYSTKKLSELQKETLSHSIGIKDSDFIKIRFNRIPAKVMKNQHENVLITSQNGVEAILNSFTKDEIKFKNIFCVGRRTKKLIENRIGKVTYVAKNALKLAEYVAKETDIKEVSYFCSNLRLDVLPAYLKASDVHVNEVEAYKTMLSSVKIDDDVSGVLFYSPSGIESYLEENSTEKVAFCIGETTAVEARKHFDKVEVANMPDVDSVLELVNMYYSNPNFS